MYTQFSFKPNGRNLGGRTQIENLQRNHILALINSQPTVTTHKPPKPHVGKSKSKVQQFIGDEVRETYRRVMLIKHGFTDTSEPRTYVLKNQLSRKHSQQKQTQQTNHQNNINAMVRNIITINNKTQKRIGQMINKSRILKVNESTRSQRHEWDDRATHPMQSEWSRIRPYSTKGNKSISLKFSKKSQGGGRRATFGTNSITNLLSMESSIDISKQSNRPLFHQQSENAKPMKQLHTLSQEQYENYLIDQYEHEQMPPPPQEKQQNKAKSLLVKEVMQDYKINQVYQIYDQRTNTNINIVIPFIQKIEESKQYKLAKRVLMQIIMDQKIFKKEMIVQLGQCLVQRNPWLEEEFILEICEDIGSNLYNE